MLNRRRLRRAHARPVNTQPEFTMQEDKVLSIRVYLAAWVFKHGLLLFISFFLHEKKINFKD